MKNNYWIYIELINFKIILLSKYVWYNNVIYTVYYKIQINEPYSTALTCLPITNLFKSSLKISASE